MAKSKYSRASSLSSDSDDDEEFARPARRINRGSLKSRSESKFVGLEEGEISSDELDDDEDDGLDDNLIGGEDDKRKLEKMSEKEREEELFKRAERRDAIQARRAVKQKLKEKREKERAEKAAEVSRGNYVESSKSKKGSTYSHVFSSDSDEALNSDSSTGEGPRGLRQRKIALEKRKEANSHKFHELIERRKQQAAKKRRVMSGSEGEQDSSVRNDTRRSSSSSGSEYEARPKQTSKPQSKKSQLMSEQVFSSDASDSSDSSRGRPTTQRASYSSLSGSQHSDSSSEDDARGRSRSPEEELVSSVDQLSRIRLSRFKIEKWVHMPFFDNLIKGCFVRINIGLHQGVPIYRCAEVVDVLETPKIYDLGDTRTNKGVVVRIAKDQSTFRLAFISNSDFQQDEFESWLRRMNEANMKPPTMSFVRSKVAEIQDAITRPIRDDRIVEQIIQSKRRFQKAPTNFAMRKAELLKQREQCELDGNTDLLKRIDMELEEIESQAERIDRRRTMGFKSITSINQRNRILSVQQAEEAIRKESEEAQNSKADDPFTRVHSQPVIVTKKYLEKLRHKRLEKLKEGDSNTASENTCSTPSASTPQMNTSLANSRMSGSLPMLLGSTPSGNDTRILSTPEPVSWILGDDNSNMSTPHESLHAIHNFEININLDLDGDQTGVGNGSNRSTNSQQDLIGGSRPRPLHSSESADNRNLMNGSSPATPINDAAGRSNRRLLNLQEYKKRHGLI